MNLLQDLSKKINTNKFRLFLLFIYTFGLYAVYRCFTDVSVWWIVAGIVWAKIVILIGHNIGMHRLFSHMSFDTNRLGENIIAWFSVLVGVGSPIQYARNHRFHHLHSDKPLDWHSPKNDGYLFTMFGLWQFRPLSWFMQRGGMMPRDLLYHPTYKFIHDNYYLIWATLLSVTCLIDWRIALYLVIFPSFFYHMEVNLFTNCICHGLGYRNFNTPDGSTNNKWLQWWMMGESLHNNHHGKSNLYDFAVKRGEFDFSGWVAEKLFAVPGTKTHTGKVRTT